MVKIGIIGGSGLDDPKIMQNPEEKEVDTPYGKPTSNLTIGKISGTDVAILARHGKGHTITPTHVNYRANIWALKQEGATHILATTACGSLRKDIGRGDLVIIDQFIDFTKHRAATFHEDFKDGIKHTPIAEPFDRHIRNLLIAAGKDIGFKMHEKGTVITIEGPRFSTKAESKMFRSWGADLINMSIASETVLAAEAGIPYAVVAMATDYDCLFDDVPPVTWEDILHVFKQNSENVKKLLLEVIPKIR